MGTPRQDFFTKKVSKPAFSSGSIRTPQKNQSPMSLLRFLLPLLVVVMGGGYFFRQNSWDMIVPEQKEEVLTGYQIASQIQQEGILKEESSDMVVYTHTLTNAQGEVFLLKSKQVPLSNYSHNLSGVVQIVGTIASFYQGLPLVEVETIGSNVTQELTGTTVTPEQTNPLGMYFAEAGLYFGSDFFEKYTFVGTPGANGEFVVQNLDSNKITKINYFVCSNVGDTNCQQLVSTFKGTALRTSTNLDGDTFYTLETGSWFFQNNNWRGYFIHDAENAEVEQLKNLISLASPQLISGIVAQHGIKVCLGIDNGLNKIASHTVNRTKKGLEITMQGTGEKNFTCQATLDLAKPAKLNFVDIKTIAVQTETQTGTQVSASLPEKTEKSEKSDSPTTVVKTPSLDPNAVQFPTSTEKTFTYTSNRGGYAIVLPSMNIAYEGFTPDKTLENLGGKCSYGLRVVPYKQKEALSSAPALVIYECKQNDALGDLGANFLVKEAANKTFVFEIMDSSFVNFANAVVINSL